MKPETKIRRLQRIIARGIGDNLSPRNIAKQIQIEIERQEKMETRKHRIAIVGSRKFPNEQQVIDYVKQLPLNVVVVSGGATGVDRWAVEAATKRGIETKFYVPDWINPDGTTNYKAGFERNSLIVDDCDELVAFWDGASKGTQDSITKARAAGKQVVIIKPIESPASVDYVDDDVPNL